MELAATSEPHPFRWAELQHEPKVCRSCLSRSHRTTEYEILHTGGFQRLCTERGRVYWLAQNERDHLLPDWKVHFSVNLQQIPVAWDILSELFVSCACDFGMKAVSADAMETWPERQRGRELTVYIFQDHPAYSGGGPMMGLCPEGSEHRFWLGPEFQRDSAFWWQFIKRAEAALQAAGVTSRGVADGDLSLGPCASLRNEAFIQDSSSPGLFIYPPNAAGWNHAGHRCPLHLPWSTRWGQGLRSLRCPGRRS